MTSFQQEICDQKATKKASGVKSPYHKGIRWDIVVPLKKARYHERKEKKPCARLLNTKFLA